ncbi:MAG: protein translocase subunit SecF [Thermodesulfobacteriota bacterium]
MQIIKPDINIDFMGKRNLLLVVSAVMLLICLLPLVLRGGPNYGIDFAGGILVQVKFAQPTTPADIREALKPLGMDDSMVQPFGHDEDNEYLIRAEKQELNLDGLGEQVAQALKVKYADEFEVRRLETVGPKVGKDLRQQALLAIFFALLLMAVYISGRFEAKWVLSAVMAGVLIATTLVAHWVLASLLGLGDTTVIVLLIVVALGVTMAACWVLRLRYAMGAVVSLSHDVLITVGLFSLLNKEFNLATVAAILTIIGYSLNDTIIVYDRIRENLRKGGRKGMIEITNQSVNQTLGRTILTGGTTIIVLIVLYLLGGGVLEDFALILLIGVLVGTYSSVYVASPMLLLMPESGGLKLNLPQPGPAAKPAARPAPRRAAEPAEATPAAAPRAAGARQVRGRATGTSRAKRKKR